jgi:hypothetical protein
MKVQPGIAHVGRKSCGVSFTRNLWTIHLSLKEHLGGREFYSNEEVELAIREWYECKMPISTATGFSNLYQDRIMHLCTGIVLKKLLWNK